MSDGTKKQCKTCIHMDAAHFRSDAMCIPQVFNGKGHKSTLDNIPCRFYEEAPLTMEEHRFGITTKYVWDENYGGYVEQRGESEPVEYIEKPFSKEYTKLIEQLDKKEITLGDMLAEVLDVPLYADKE